MVLIIHIIRNVLCDVALVKHLLNYAINVMFPVHVRVKFYEKIDLSNISLNKNILLLTDIDVILAVDLVLLIVVAAVALVLVMEPSEAAVLVEIVQQYSLGCSSDGRNSRRNLKSW